MYELFQRVVQHYICRIIALESLWMFKLYDVAVGFHDIVGIDQSSVKIKDS